MNKIDLDRIKKAVLGELYFFETVKSTNLEALKTLEAPDKSLFLAENQTAGRGSKGRSWLAGYGGIYMTVLVRPKKIGADFSALTLAAGLAVARAIPKMQIKWPNDIIAGGKKVAGILVETKIFGKNAIAAVGIGINANNTDFPEELREKATSIAQVTGETQDTAELVIRVYNEFLAVYERFSKGFSEIRAEYLQKCVTVNREIEVIKNGKSRKMFAVGIGDSGELLAEYDGKTERINFGDVSVRGILGYI
ncbi:MAG: biotin--[Clostridia bacterium]|nr:biotin--[acetyl-CoA-carboxylase] ligase [Clostridia bacterium]